MNEGIHRQTESRIKILEASRSLRHGIAWMTVSVLSMRLLPTME